MDTNELATFHQAVKYAQSGYNEKAFEYIKMLAQKDPNNIDLIFWGMYAAPNPEWADILFERAKRVAPGHAALIQAEQWLTNEKLRLPHPSIGYSLFPPNINTVQLGTSSGSYAGATESYWNPPTQSPYAPPSAQTLPVYPASIQAPTMPVYPPMQAPTMPIQAMPYQPPQYYPTPMQAPMQVVPQSYAQVMPVYALTCRYCRCTLPPRNGRRISTGGWVTFGIILMFFFPLCWIGLLFKENYRICSQCGQRFDY